MTTSQVMNPETSFPYERKCPFSRPDEYSDLEREGGVHKVRLATGLDVWAVTGWHNIRSLLTDARTSASRKHDNFPFYFPAPPEFRTETSFIGFDGEEHKRTRRLAAVTFTARRVKNLRPRIEQIINERYEAIEELDEPFDFHQHFSLPVPMTVICELLGVPYEDHEFFQRNGTILLGGHVSREARQAALVDVSEYLLQLVKRKRRNPDEEGLVSRAIRQADESSETFSDKDIANLARLLMNGGHETTASMLSLGTGALLEHPDQLRLIREDKSFVPQAVEELVRYATIGDAAIPRVATEDIELGGATIKAGDGILCLGLTGNRDESLYESPDELDITRGNRQHFGFGHGVHHCIGADLARAEMELVWSTLFDRFPNMSLETPMNELGMKHAAVIYGPWELPIRLRS